MFWNGSTTYDEAPLRLVTVDKENNRTLEQKRRFQCYYRKAQQLTTQQN